VGKSRLALQVAAGPAYSTGDGEWFADLAPLDDPCLVTATVADVLGIQEEPGRAVLGTLVEAVGGRSLLLVLDNCEHLIGACANLADALLRGCPNLALLATSREPLGIDGEHVYRVPSMGTPADGDDAKAIQDSEAVRLLADRAVAQGAPLAWDEHAAAVAGRICRRLDGIPLAIELAAARLRVMSAAELEARLDERLALLTGGSRAALPRQQTLRAMVDWSWELLVGVERGVLARLSVFAGAFGLAAAEAVVAGPEVLAGEVVGHLGTLVDKSLVQFGDTGAGTGRYRLLETVRQYAAWQLDARGPGAVSGARIAHRDYYLALAEAAAPQLEGPDQASWLARLDAELDNLRAAIAFCAAQADPGPGLRLAASLRVYWLARGHVAEGAGQLQALLDVPATPEATLPRARALTVAANLLERLGSYATAERYCEEALAIARAAGDDQLVAELRLERAWLLLRQGQSGAALLLIEQALAYRLRAPRLTALLLSARSTALEQEGDQAGAVRDADQALQAARQAGDQRLAGMMLGNLGNFDLTMDDLKAARRHLRESLGIARALKDRCAAVYQTFNLGLAEYLGDSPAAAEELFAESLDLAMRAGMQANMACALIGLAMVGHGGADHGWSARLHGAGDQALANLGHALEPLEGRLADLERQRLRSVMGAEAFDAEYAVGSALDLGSLAREALPVIQAEHIARPDNAQASVRDAAASAEAASTLVEIRVLGPVTAFRDGVELDLGQPQARAVAAMLALRAGTDLAVDELIDGVYGSQVPRRARKVIQTYISRLRQILGRDVIMTLARGEGYRIQLAADAVDASRCERLLAQARTRMAAGSDADAAGLFTKALPVLAVEPLLGVPGPAAESARRRLAGLRLAAMEDLAETWLRMGRHAEASAELAREAVAHPMNERLHRLLMIARYRSGRQDEAVATYLALRNVLDGELGVAPSAETEAVYAGILGHDPALMAPAASASVCPRRNS
jgi:non-specific serine/threonine protein kinase